MAVVTYRYKMKKTALILTAFLLFLILIGLNIGKWIDVTEKPLKADIIVCLGGGTIERVKKSIKLYEDGYSNANKILLLGESWYNQPYIEKYHAGLPIIIEERLKNTADEVAFIKKYMKEYGYTSALIVTDPTHSRRVSLLTSIISIRGDEEINFYYMDSEVKWWNDRYYYKHKLARTHVADELIKIFYNLVAYGILDKIGILDDLIRWSKSKE